MDLNYSVFTEKTLNVNTVCSIYSMSLTYTAIHFAFKLVNLSEMLSS